MSAELEERVHGLELARLDELEAKKARARKRRKAKRARPSTDAEFEGVLGEAQYLDDPKLIRSFVQAVADGKVGSWGTDNPAGVTAIKEGKARDTTNEEDR